MAQLLLLATALDAAALLTHRIAWRRDHGRWVTDEAATAKTCAAEGARPVIGPA